MEVLDDNILADGNFYEGDLLKAVLTSKPEFWKNDVENWKRMCEIYERDKKLLDEDNTTKTIREGWYEAYAEFKK